MMSHRDVRVASSSDYRVIGMEMAYVVPEDIRPQDPRVFGHYEYAFLRTPTVMTSQNLLNSLTENRFKLIDKDLQP
ncbi:hypothetical protein HNY73_005571 [Argiope bruennichi]|uniref:Uncharacterized protein n=1 Tax=Argiope bruennichi TaxID=94029 RepID=A0A8T0FH05_ARGBR|nr:hypothetical protein HNY73_005571 [Argiope bruennichi]